ncbi:MAG TPA: prepilin-type N-terminal cleavage/methylation domain-containing protein [Candidatus Rifleibacterium sp.]|nr:prepilin-type N-terminal cleavage/methylation domain-containing protein [Candidatus Rifleibacterium sp.]HOI90272.1 prepilin-type N-terminal cleavage/methylation domain-containing protein [Candidatus Rifleibacterium sp.]
MKRRGFSLLEVIIAMAFLSVAILSMFWMNRASNQGSMDAYYEFLAFSLAREPIEVFRGFGYDYLKMVADGNVSPPAWYPVGTMKDIEFSLMSDMQYPAEARLFQRLIELTPVTAGKLQGMRIKVTVAVKGQSRVEVWMSRKAVSLESLVMERPK